MQTIIEVVYIDGTNTFILDEIPPKGVKDRVKVVFEKEKGPVNEKRSGNSES